MCSFLSHFTIRVTETGLSALFSKIIIHSTVAVLIFYRLNVFVIAPAELHVGSGTAGFRVVFPLWVGTQLYIPGIWSSVEMGAESAEHLWGFPSRWSVSSGTPGASLVAEWRRSAGTLAELERERETESESDDNKMDEHHVRWEEAYSFCPL